MKAKKLKEYIEKTHETATRKGKFPKGISSQYVFQELVRVYNGKEVRVWLKDNTHRKKQESERTQDSVSMLKELTMLLILRAKRQTAKDMYCK